jgi:inosine-uridine nucleoside N-ribohydrolase
MSVVVRIGRASAESGSGPPAGALRVPVLIDCDPGIDDALAILLALASPELDVLGVTTVAGNTTLERATANALRVLAFAGRGDVPTAAGAGRPLVRRLEATAVETHGPDGLGVGLPPPAAAPVAEHARRVTESPARSRSSRPGR